MPHTAPRGRRQFRLLAVPLPRRGLHPLLFLPAQEDEEGKIALSLQTVNFSLGVHFKPVVWRRGGDMCAGNCSECLQPPLELLGAAFRKATRLIFVPSFLHWEEEQKRAFAVRAFASFCAYLLWSTQTHLLEAPCAAVLFLSFHAMPVLQIPPL